MGLPVTYLSPEVESKKGLRMQTGDGAVLIPGRSGRLHWPVHLKDSGKDRQEYCQPGGQENTANDPVGP